MRNRNDIEALANNAAFFAAEQIRFLDNATSAPFLAVWGGAFGQWMMLWREFLYLACGLRNPTTRL